MLRRLSLPARLTFAISVSALLLVGAGGIWQVTAEEADLRRAVARELRLLGRSLQVAFENALRDRQAEDVEETLRELERIDPTVDIFVYDRAGRRVAASTGAMERSHRLRHEPERADLRFLEDTATPHAELVLPLYTPGTSRPATLVVVRLLSEMHADLSATRRRIVLSTAVFVVGVFLVTFAFSHYGVGRPLRQMIAHMRRVRAGDLSPSGAELRRQDEIGATLAEFDALVLDLAAARTRLETEGEARRRLELALREVDKLATIGQLAAGLAHEIGSPLQILDGRIASLARKADDPRETRRLAGILRDQTQRITRIVSRLMGLARRRSVPIESIDPEPPIRTVVELLEGEAQRRGVKLALETPSTPLALRGDADSIQQVALNLVRNALDATSAGGTIVVRMAPSELTRADGLVLCAVRLLVCDTGRGIDEAERPHVFEPFFTTRAAEGGTGLGLAVVQGIVHELGGRVQVESAVGRGTTFTVDIPSGDFADGFEERRGRIDDDA